MASKHSARKNSYVCETTSGEAIITIILNFLTLFMPMTLSKRAAGIILTAADQDFLRACAL